MSYIYQADVWCDRCGKEICERIQAEGHAPEDPDDEGSFDSDEYPKRGEDEEETDSPQHCAAHGDCLDAIEMGDGTKIGCLIGTTLTTDGVEYVKEAIREALEKGEDEKSSVALAIWRKAFSDYDVVETMDWSEVFDAISECLSNREDSADQLVAIHNQVCSRKIIARREGEDDVFYYIDAPK